MKHIFTFTILIGSSLLSQISIAEQLGQTNFIKAQYTQTEGSESSTVKEPYKKLAECIAQDPTIINNDNCSDRNKTSTNSGCGYTAIYDYTKSFFWLRNNKAYFINKEEIIEGSYLTGNWTTSVEDGSIIMTPPRPPSIDRLLDKKPAQIHTITNMINSGFSNLESNLVTHLKEYREEFLTKEAVKKIKNAMCVCSKYNIEVDAIRAAKKSIIKNLKLQLKEENKEPRVLDGEDLSCTDLVG